MKIKNSHFLFLFVLPIILLGCKDIIAVNISDVTPEIIIPSTNDTVQVNPVHFKWKEVEGATKYHLEVVSPSFASISQFNLDTIISGLDFFAPLDSSEYEMRLTALNAGYTSNSSSIIHFWVGVSPSSGSSQIALLLPENNGYYNETFNGLFDWENVTGAQSYEFYLKKGSSFETGISVDYSSELEISSKTVSTSLFSEGEFHWGVRAYYSNGTESVLSKRRFYIDTTNPVQPTLQAPLNGSNQIPGSINFSWNSGSDAGLIQSPITSILEISTDIGFSQPDIYNINGNSTSITINGTLGQIYYWRIKNRDAAGNLSPYSTIFNISF